MPTGSNPGYSLADQDLARRVKLFLNQHRLVAGNVLSIAVDRGVATLRGAAPSFHRRQLIVSATQRVAGARQIIDELTVDQPRPVDARPRWSDRSLTGLAATVAVVVMIALAGCGRGPSRVATHPTRGSVTYQGQPISGAFVALHPKTGAQPDVPTSTAIVQPDGTFAVTTYDTADGVPEGDYVVTVQWRKATKSGGEFLPGPNLLPAKYSRPETSGIVVHVASGQNELKPIALKR